MKPVQQTILHNPPATIGNCFVACLASILEYPIEKIPHFAEIICDNRETFHCDIELWYAEINKFLEQFSLQYFSVWADDYAIKHTKGFHIIEGQSPRGAHAVVGKDGKMVFDPHPKNEGLVKVENFGLFICNDPSRINHV